MKLDNLADQVFKEITPYISPDIIPGMVFGIIDKHGERAIRAYGHAQVSPDYIQIEEDSWFDLASLTKVIFTTTKILEYYDQGIIDLNDKISLYIPDLRQYDSNAKERNLTIKNLLTHNTCLPAVEPIYTYGLAALTTRAYILQKDWRKMSESVYSDINFMLLGIALERITGKPLRNIKPHNIGLTFLPEHDKCVATEYCTWRDRLIRGEVHDENAYSFGGVSGHAGLFGTVDGVLDFAQAFIKKEVLKKETLGLLKLQYNDNRTLGWELKSPNWHGGESCSANTIGHTGFTGTALWLDMDKGIGWTLLTNRVHPSRHTKTPINKIRKIMSNIVTHYMY